MKTTLFALFVGLLMVGCGESSEVTSEPYSNPEHDCSFRYPKNWKVQKAQLPTTLVLLYSEDGHSTINLSVVPADRSTIEKYDEDYFNYTYKKVFPDLRINRVWETQSFSRKYSFVDYSYSITTLEGVTPVRSITLVALSRGNRYKLVCNTKQDFYEKMKPIFNLVTSTFLIL